MDYLLILSQIILGILAVMLVLDIVLRTTAVYIILPIFERRPPFGIRPAFPDPKAEVIEFPTTDGLKLRGSLYRNPELPPKGLVVFCPEFGGSHWSAKWYCNALIDAGFSVLSFDFRNQGASEHLASYRVMHWLSDYEVQDAISAVEYAQSREELADLPVGMFGISRGGGAALATGAKLDRVEAVATEGAFTTDSMMFHFAIRWATLYFPPWIIDRLPDLHMRISLTIVRWISQWRHGCHYLVLEKLLRRLKKKPVMMMNGTKDSYVHMDIPHKILKRAGGQPYHQLWEIPNAKHNLGRETIPEEYDQKLVEYFSQTLNSEASAVEPSVRTSEIS
ncbi:Alpha/beta hydrolase family protein [Polystyrenella longa]|uniref:Alpha/beta hydrolase family protein n=1 Tax=Polystyrenella longa TaxID=2528007 RepID=A0A518CGR1_9PLAN|nr:alpha/beta fold hydrolase [Polystyrenella longa]QDU78407.1 Alpha/beta hydrolase family protein [Polystyrenella longa]